MSAMNRNIACVGSRATPAPIISWMEETAAKLVTAGHTINSGNAPGADQAWARGANTVDPSRVVLFLPWDSFERQAIHPKNRICTFRPMYHQQYVQLAIPNASLRGTPEQIALLARDAMIVDNVHCVLGYVAAGKSGTRHTFGIAQLQQIITLNVSDALVRAGIDQRLANGEDVRGPVFDTGKGRKW
jgi:hypothetical protein